MKLVSAALDAHLGSTTTSLSTCFLVTWVNGTVKTFNSHDLDIVYEGNTYLANSGYTASDVATSDALNVDNLEIEGAIVSPSITEADLGAGLWDYAQIQIFMLNWADTSQGKLYQRVGRLGEVTLDRGVFRAELRGLTQAYSRSIGQLTSPSCRYDLGDSRCKVNLLGGSPNSLTVTGTLTGVHTDRITLYDTARTEAGPLGGKAISAVTVANPGVVTATAHGFSNGAAVTIRDVNGPTFINTTTIVRSATANQFTLPVSTIGYAAYSGSGGTVTPMGADSGFFDHGVITMTSGPNIGLQREVKSYVPGQWQLHLPFPYAVSVGETYSMHAGCNKLRPTCRDRFVNIENFGGEPDLPGIDQLVQTGRRS